MRSKGLVVILAGLLLAASFGCKKQEEAKEAPAAPAVPAPHAQMGQQPAAPKDVAVPEDVRAAWKEVTISVQNKENGQSKTYEVKPESEFDVPETNLKVKIGAYLPDFTMGNNQITSRSAEPNNPALQVTVLEDGAEKYKGWLFAKFPDMHAYENPKIGITLVDKNAGAAQPAM